MALKFKKRKETNHIVVHCSATLNDPKINRAVIAKWHRGKGWMDIGYHFVILTDGTIEIGRDVDAIGAHVAGHNEDTIGICMVGGVDAEGKSTNNFTKEQFDKLKKLLVELLLEYPKANVMGHRDFEGVKKDCPCFDAKDWFYNTNTRGYTTVVVERGDTLFFLARKYGTTVQDIVDMNNLISTNIKIGEILKIPA